MGDPQSLRIRTILNGEVVQDGTTADMVFGVAELVSYVEIAQALNDSGALALLEHPEHTTVQPPGGRIYKVLRQYEYRPSALPQRVAD